MATLLAPRTAPFPGDIRLGGKSLVLQRPKDGAPLVRQRALDLVSAVSTEFLYSRASPLKERPQTYTHLTSGMGLDEQQAQDDLRYSYTLGADLSCGVWQKGPAIATLTPATTAAWATQFGFEIAANLYGLAGRYVLVRASDASWTVSKDLGLGHAALQAEAFYSNVGGGSQLAFVAVDGDKAWYFNGTTWTQFATFTALCWKVVGRDLYRAHDINLVSKCTTDADPTVEANYTSPNQFIIGDKSSPIVSMAKTIGEVLLILKTDGVWTLASDGTAHHLFPALQFEPGVDNGKVVGYFGNDIFVTYGQSFYRITPDLTLDPIGPDRTVGSTAPVKGRMTAFTGVGALFGIGAIYTLTDSYILKFGGFEPNTQTSAGPIAGELVRLDAWHGSISQVFANKKLTALQTSTVGAPAGHTRTYAGFSDGSMAWFTNPCVPNPMGCAQYRWTTTDAYVYLPRWHGVNLEDNKALHSLSVMGPLLDATNYVEFDYKTVVTAVSWISFGTSFQGIREKVPFALNTFGPFALFRVILKSVADTSTPQVSAVIVWHAWRPDRVMDITFSVQAGDGLLLRNGTPLRLSSTQIVALCQAAVDTPGTITTILPTGSVEEVSYLDMTQNIDWDVDHGDFGAVVQMRGVTFPIPGSAGLLPAGVVYGTWDRVSTYQYDSLSTMSWDALPTL